MKLKIKLAVIALIFNLTINGQISYDSDFATINVSLILSDNILEDQTSNLNIELKGQDSVYFREQKTIRLKIDLEDKSTIKENVYLKISPVIYTSLGLTTPVIIPPILNDSVDINDSFGAHRRYPHVLRRPLDFVSTENTLALYLIKYKNKEDFLKDDNGTLGEILSPVFKTKVFFKRFDPKTKLNSKKNEFAIYPVPFQNSITINRENNAPIKVIKLLTLQGQVLKTIQEGDLASRSKGEYIISGLQELKIGPYLLQIDTGQKKHTSILFKDK